MRSPKVTGNCVRCGRHGRLYSRHMCHKCAIATKPTTCSWCGKPLPAGRSRFCSDECGRIFHRAQADELEKNTPALPPNPNRKHRVCLRCDKLFVSEGPGYRFCTKCSEINAQLADRLHVSRFAPAVHADDED